MKSETITGAVQDKTNSGIYALENYIGRVADLNANRHHQRLIDDLNRGQLIRKLQGQIDNLRVQIWLTAISTSLISITASTIIVAVTL